MRDKVNSGIWLSYRHAGAGLHRLACRYDNPSWFYPPVSGLWIRLLDPSLSFAPRPHIQRQAARTTACPLPRLLGDGNTLIETVYGEEKIFCTGLTRSEKDRIKVTCTCMMSPTKQPRKDPSHLYSSSPHSPQFQHSGLSACAVMWIIHARQGKSIFFVYLFSGLLYWPSIAAVAHFVFLRDVWIRTQRAAVASRRGTNLATHLPYLTTHLHYLFTHLPLS
jgi:hypothetical protein